jgi:hypothetical protein
MLSFTALSAAIYSAIYFRLRRKRTAEDLWAGALVFWALLALLTTLLLPGGSYLFTLPLLFAALALGATLFLKTIEGSERSLKGTALLAACIAPCVVILVPTIYLLFICYSILTACRIQVNSKRQWSPEKMKPAQ